MITDKFSIGIYQIGASFLIAIIALYVSFSFLYKTIFKRHGITIDNTAYSALAASILFSIGFLISGASQSIITTVKILRSTESGMKLWTDMLSYTALFMVIALIVALAVNVLSYFMFTRLTKSVDEFDEIKRNNLAVGIITSAIVISITLIVKDSMVYMIESLVPYPEIPAMY
jgi:uncharacterized membrane protein YjfL (UPF0719 family)